MDFSPPAFYLSSKERILTTPIYLAEEMTDPEDEGHLRASECKNVLSDVTALCTMPLGLGRNVFLRVKAVLSSLCKSNLSLHLFAPHHVVHDLMHDYIFLVD